MIFKLIVDGRVIEQNEYVQPLVKELDRYARNISFDHAEICKVDSNQS